MSACQLRTARERRQRGVFVLLVVVLDGEGSMLLGDEERPVGPHSIIYIPRGTTHSMRNTSGHPSAAYAMFVPPFDGKDRVPVESPAPAAAAAQP